MFLPRINNSSLGFFIPVHQQGGSHRSMVRLFFCAKATGLVIRIKISNVRKNFFILNGKCQGDNINF